MANDMAEFWMFKDQIWKSNPFNEGYCNYGHECRMAYCIHIHICIFHSDILKGGIGTKTEYDTFCISIWPKQYLVLAIFRT